MSRYTEPHWSRSALITIDTQNDFALAGAQAEIPGTSAILPTMKKLVEAYRQAKQPIIHVIRLYKEDGSNADLCRREALEKGAAWVLPGGTGAELVDDLKPSKNSCLDSELLLNGHFQQLGAFDWVMYKPRWGAFYQTNLEAFLVERGIDTLVFSGCNFPNCPRTSMYEASERDFRVVMSADAISGVYEKGLQEMQNIGVSVLSSDEIIKHIVHSR